MAGVAGYGEFAGQLFAIQDHFQRRALAFETGPKRCDDIGELAKPPFQGKRYGVNDFGIEPGRGHQYKRPAVGKAIVQLPGLAASDQLGNCLALRGRPSSRASTLAVPKGMSPVAGGAGWF